MATECVCVVGLLIVVCFCVIETERFQARLTITPCEKAKMYPTSHAHFDSSDILAEERWAISYDRYKCNSYQLLQNCMGLTYFH